VLENDLTKSEWNKAPISANEVGACLWFFLLPDTKVDVRSCVDCLTLRHRQIGPMTIALILPVNVDEHGKAGRDVALRSQVYAEVDVLTGHTDVTADVLVLVVGPVLAQLRVGPPKLD